MVSKINSENHLLCSKFVCSPPPPVQLSTISSCFYSAVTARIENDREVFQADTRNDFFTQSPVKGIVGENY